MSPSATPIRTGCPGASRPTFEPFGLHRRDQVAQDRIQPGEVSNWLCQLRQHLALQQLTTYVERLLPDVEACKDQDVEDEVDDWGVRRALILECIERRSSIGIEKC
jgi:hypothetical protein